MPKSILEPYDRRELTLRALRGDNRAALGREYGITRKHVYDLMYEAEKDTVSKVAEATAELAFRKAVLKEALQKKSILHRNYKDCTKITGDYKREEPGRTPPDERR